MSEIPLKQESAQLVDENALDEQGFLLRLGQRVRQIRAQRGMSRRLLAETADVSERYLAQLETGKGNVSILLLRQIAAAMGVRVDTLVDLEHDLPDSYELIREHLRSMDDSALRRVQDYLFSKPGHTDLKHNRVALLGLRGAGKSTVGKQIANELDIPFIELTDVIEDVAGMSLNEIFSLGGQSSYRKFEQQALDKIMLETKDGILAVGGSVVADTTTYEKLLSAFTTVWLQASPEEHMQRVLEQGDNRPMAGNRRAMDELRRILIEREPLYRRADHVVDTHNKSIKQTCADVLALDVFKQ